MNPDIISYNQKLTDPYDKMSDYLAQIINESFKKETELKIWHAHPVWFINGNPIVGYSLQKAGLRLMFWSGADFQETKLIPSKGKFKDASIFYTNINDINENEIRRWINLSENIQWDYKNLIKRKGQLVKL